MTVELNNKISIKIEPVNKSKTRLIGLFYDDRLILREWYKIVDLVECFQAFQKNHLSMDETYTIDYLIELELRKKNDKVTLAVYIDNSWLYFNKLESAQIAHKISRVLARCDIFLE